uniref:Uncharacterized protein n=1 Tax=uncultured bacterium contig00025 TaxID=1181514 RepID=A0A806KMW8_9BACT|nr:hypothetical protein [uncultured bacterium contig00025]
MSMTDFLRLYQIKRGDSIQSLKKGFMGAETGVEPEKTHKSGYNVRLSSVLNKKIGIIPGVARQDA